jgi:hypothetical protein
MIQVIDAIGHTGDCQREHLCRKPLAVFQTKRSCHPECIVIIQKTIMLIRRIFCIRFYCPGRDFSVGEFLQWFDLERLI